MAYNDRTISMETSIKDLWFLMYAQEFDNDNSNNNNNNNNSNNNNSNNVYY